MVREGLERLEGVETVSENACAQTWTCRLRMEEGRLPDLDVLARSILEFRAGATLRGVEAEIEGWLVKEPDGLVLTAVRPAGGAAPHTVSGGHAPAVLALAPLERKVAWDVAADRPEAITAEERAAYEQLRARANREAVPVRVAGTLAASHEGEQHVLQVRQFRWIAADDGGGSLPPGG